MPPPLYGVAGAFFYAVFSFWFPYGLVSSVSTYTSKGHNVLEQIELSYTGTDVIDGEYPDALRKVNQHCNQKTTVVEQIQRLFFSLRTRLNMNLDVRVMHGPEEANHQYRLQQASAPSITASFRSLSPLSPTSMRRPQKPQSIGQFNVFLDKINSQVDAPYNAAFTDALRILTVCNEGEFQIDSYSEDGESVLALTSSRLRQSVEFIVAH